MNTPDDLKYTSEHEWIKVEGEVATVGITDYAQDALGDVTYVELPAVGDEVSAGDEVGSVESSKAASSIYAPVDGTVAEINEALDDAPELVNDEPYSAGWMYKLTVSDSGQLAKLLDAAAYEEACGKEE